MTFSDLSFWFKSINAGCSAAKRNISKVYGLKSCDVMEGWMHRLSDIRNICAHHGILIDSYSYKSRIRLVKSISTNYREYYYLKDEIEISKSNDRFAHDGLYNNIVILMYLMDIIDQGSEWRTKVISLLENYSQKVLRMNRRIGLPEDWSRRKIWNVSL
jgi:abortive infection bacteriophage resistance protein